MFKKLMNKVLGDPNKRLLNSLEQIVDGVNQLEAKYKPMSDDQLREASNQLRERVQSGTELDNVLSDAFAIVREASIRTTGLRHYDVQIMGGTLLHQNNVVEMRTGEGKTLVATLPLYLNGLKGHGVHLVTVNDYLARRDGGWMGKIFNYLGLSVGCIGPEQFSGLYDPDYINPGAELEDERLVHWRPCTRKEAYAADVTYGTSSEFGFDYLRDNMVMEKNDLVQRELFYAVIDEVDNVLIDESRTPLIISGPASRSGQEYVRFATYVRHLKENTAPEGEDPNGHYSIDHKARSVTLTEPGIAEIERRIPEIDSKAGDSLYDPSFFHLTYYLDNAMKAQYLFHRDQEYMIQDGQIVIIDDFTGRPMPSRRYSDGLHEAIEAKEQVEVKRETTTVATVTLQNYFRMYKHLAGMTGTAMTDAEEFDLIYSLGVFPLPTNVEQIVSSGKMGLVAKHRDENGARAIYYVDPKSDKTVFFKRTDYPDQVYGTQDAKDVAIVEEIVEMHKTGRPVLVGTTSVEHSEKIAQLLDRNKVSHNVLNAKMHQSEALVVAQAGRRGTVTISTNMAGRGTDILLGGNAEGLAAGALEEELFDRPLLKRLAEIWVVNGEEAARDFAERSNKLESNLVDGLINLKASLEESSKEIESVQLINYVARKLSDQHKIDPAVARQAFAQVRLGAMSQARDYLEENGVDMALAEEAHHMYALHGGFEEAKNDPAKLIDFLSGIIFDQNYAGRAALIRAVLANNFAEARRVAERIPGLSLKMIDHVQQFRDMTEQERLKVRELGGLHVIGSERHESRRIDNQLRGRAARQGDPGSSRFFLSLEDDLMLRFGGERLQGFMSRFDVPDDLPIENPIINKLIESSQTRIEGYNFDIRKNLVEYDDVMAKQRESIYRERRDLLLSVVDPTKQIQESFKGAVDELANNYLDDYEGFMRGEIERAVIEHTTDSTDRVNVRAVMVRLRGLLPQLRDAEYTELEKIPSRQLTNHLMKYVDQNVENGTNIYQLLQATRNFVPLLPRVPNVGMQLSARRDRAHGRDLLRDQFLGRVQELYNDFLAEQMPVAARDQILQNVQSEISTAFDEYLVDGVGLEELQNQQEPFKQKVEEILTTFLLEGLKKLNSDQLVAALDNYMIKRAEGWHVELGEETYRDFERRLLLSAIDREWRDYLTAMDDLRREIGLEAVAQRDPKVMYRKRSFEMFQDMKGNINKSVAKEFFLRVQDHAQYVQQQKAEAARRRMLYNPPVPRVATSDKLSETAKERIINAEVKRELPKLGRNDVCWCGSGKKYKSCHMKSDQQLILAQREQMILSSAPLEEEDGATTEAAEVVSMENASSKPKRLVRRNK